MSSVLHKLLVVSTVVFGASLAHAADDCDGIRSAIAKLPVQGGVVNVAAGLYNCGEPIVIDRDNVVLRGAGKDKVTIRLMDQVHRPILVIGDRHIVQNEKGQYVVTKRVKNIKVSGFTLDGNRANHDVTKECGETHCDGDPSSIRNNGITIRGASDVVVEDMIAHSTISGGMVTEKYCERLTIRNYESYNNYFDGLAGYETEQSTFENMYLHNNRGAGISLDINFNNNTLIRSRLHDNGDVGIFARFLRGNKFIQVDIQRSGNHGVFLAAAESVGTCAQDNTFASVRINGSKGAALRLNDDCAGNRITGNSDITNNQYGTVSEKVTGSVFIGNNVAR